MAAKRKGTAIGREDKRGIELFVGDFIRSNTGKVYTINKYGNPFSPVSGTAKFNTIGEFELIHEDEYNASLELEKRQLEANTKAKEAIEALMEEEPSGKRAEEVAVDLMPIATAELLVELKTRGHEALSYFTDTELMDEMRSRGFHGTISHTYEITL